MRTCFDIASLFNAGIGARDLDALSALITDDHLFIDAVGSQIRGRFAVLDAWRSFFVAFPDYRNEFTGHVDRGSEVCIEGRSSCSDSRLCGAALWRAGVRGELIAEWRVFHDTPANREMLGLRKKGK